MESISNLINSISQILWPAIVIMLAIIWKNDLLRLFRSGSEVSVEAFGSKFVVRPSQKTDTNKELPAIAEKEQLPADYIFINHTSFLRPDKQKLFQSRTGVDLPHFDIRVIVDSYYKGALERIKKVEYFLHEEYDEPIHVRINPESKFLLKEVANGEYVLTAKIYLIDRKTPVILTRYITLWESGPKLD